MTKSDAPALALAGMKRHQTPSQSYAHEAAMYIVRGLQSRDIRVYSVDEAIRQGHITDLQWCAVLDEFRKRRLGARDEAQPAQKGRSA